MIFERVINYFDNTSLMEVFFIIAEEEILYNKHYVTRYNIMNKSDLSMSTIHTKLKRLEMLKLLHVEKSDEKNNNIKLYNINKNNLIAKHLYDIYILERMRFEEVNQMEADINGK